MSPILWKDDESFIPCTQVDTRNFKRKFVKSAMIAETFTIGTEWFQTWNVYNSKNFWTAITGP